MLFQNKGKPFQNFLTTKDTKFFTKGTQINLCSFSFVFSVVISAVISVVKKFAKINLFKVPAVSVIMPVYNAAKYLQKAIDSILHQTLSDFELIIVNDCSTDESETIIKTYTDNRIKYIKQPQNMGVVAAMNTGLALVQSLYVAVMHADDISLTNRLEREFTYLEKHPETAVIAGFIENINDKDEPVGIWNEDRNTITASQIKTEMIKGNCIAHPSVMMRTAVVMKYGYSSSPQHRGYAVEDYPLWLHLLADGYVIEKIAEPLLYYRVHTQSATGTFLRSRNPFFVNYYSKKFFLQHRKEVGKWNDFDKKVRVSMYKDYWLGNLKEIKKKLSF